MPSKPFAMKRKPPADFGNDTISKALKATKPVARPDRPTRYPGERSRWLVPSESQPDYPVLVDMDEFDGAGWCACEDWHFRQKEKGPGYQCKHIEQVLIEMGKQLAVDMAKKAACQHAVVQTGNGKSFCAQCGEDL